MNEVEKNAIDAAQLVSHTGNTSVADWLADMAVMPRHCSPTLSRRAVVVVVMVMVGCMYPREHGLSELDPCRSSSPTKQLLGLVVRNQ